VVAAEPAHDHACADFGFFACVQVRNRILPGVSADGLADVRIFQRGDEPCHGFYTVQQKYHNKSLCSQIYFPADCGFFGFCEFRVFAGGFGGDYFNHGRTASPYNRPCAAAADLFVRVYARRVDAAVVRRRIFQRREIFIRRFPHRVKFPDAGFLALGNPAGVRTPVYAAEPDVSLHLVFPQLGALRGGSGVLGERRVHKFRAVLFISRHVRIHGEAGQVYPAYLTDCAKYGRNIKKSRCPTGFFIFFIDLCIFRKKMLDKIKMIWYTVIATQQNNQTILTKFAL